MQRAAANDLLTRYLKRAASLLLFLFAVRSGCFQSLKDQGAFPSGLTAINSLLV
jgi:hypothetical protein